MKPTALHTEWLKNSTHLSECLKTHPILVEQSNQWSHSSPEGFPFCFANTLYSVLMCLCAQQSSAVQGQLVHAAALSPSRCSAAPCHCSSALQLHSTLLTDQSSLPGFPPEDFSFLRGFKSGCFITDHRSIKGC